MLSLKQRTFLRDVYDNQGCDNGYLSTFENGTSYLALEHLHPPPDSIPEFLLSLAAFKFIELNLIPENCFWRSPRQQHLLNEFCDAKGLGCFEPLPDEFWPDFQHLCQSEIGYAPSDPDLTHVWIET